MVKISSLFYVYAITVLLAAAPLAAQGPDADWRTVTTPHFRVHYPRQYEAWATRAASRLESIRDAVVKEVGYSPEAVTDVLIANPYADANGLTLPLLDGPRIVFFTEPPGPEEEIGDYGDWIDLLATHEVAHMVHLMRPSRNPLRRVLERVLPLDPVTLGAPRWVLEGYATVVEGRLTGSGRPSSSFRAAILRIWAANGRLPSYTQLNSDRRFAGMSMAYLMGSAYLEWLEARSGPGSLRKMWARMTARQRRTFEQAFEGVFGDTPQKLYGVFTAELTERAVTAERSGQAVEGELWQETTRGAGDPAVSPDGSRIAVVLRPRDEPAKIVVWSTGPPQEEEEKAEKMIAGTVARDPEDVAPVRTRPLPRKPLYSFSAPDGGQLETPRWTADGRSIVYAHRQPDRESFLHYDLFRWTPSTGENVRITRLEDVHDADPFPDGRRSVAVRNRFGYSQLVTVDLTTGAIAELTPPSLDVIYAHPRLNADGKRIAFAQHGGGDWSLAVRDVPAGTQAALPLPQKRSSAAWPEWRGDILYASVFAGGFSDVYTFDPASGRSGPVTRTAGAAFEPAPSPDGRVFYMSLEPDGFVVRVLQPSPAIPQARVVPERSLVPALPPELTRPAPFVAQDLLPAKNYGIGRQELDYLAGTAHAADLHAAEAGARMGDVVGRLGVIALLSEGSGYGIRGGTLAAAWRGWPVEIGGHLFAAKEHGARLRAGLLRASWSAERPQNRLTLTGNALAGRLNDSSRNLGELAGSFATWQLRGSVRADEEIALAGTAGATSDDAWYLGRGSASVAVGVPSLRVGLRYEHAATSRARSPYDLVSVGGLQSSIVPAAYLSSRVFDPALTPFSLAGSHYDGLRLQAEVSGLTFFWQQHRVPGERLPLAGAEWTMDLPPIALLKLPASSVTAGAARLLDEHRTRWWFGLRWRP